jgi:hypothetical protein
VKGYRLVLHWAALPITDRRWAAPLSAVALGFGLFAGVAIGPGAADTVATGAAQIVAIPGVGGGSQTAETEDAPTARPAPDATGGADLTPSDPADTGLPSFEPAPLVEPESTGSPEIAAAPLPDEEEPAPREGQSEPEDEVLTGVVVHLNKAAGSYVVAGTGGSLAAVHAATAPRLGTAIEVPVRTLANGTFAEAGTRVRSGSRSRAEVRGVVTYVDSSEVSPAYVVSERGVSLFVRVGPDPTGSPPPLPMLGSIAEVTVDIEKTEPVSDSAEPLPDSEPAPSTTESTFESGGCAPDPAEPLQAQTRSPFALWQRHLEVAGTPLGQSDFSGVVVAVCPHLGQILLSADDVRASGRDLLFDLAAEDIDLSKVQVGDSILATARIGTGGKLSLTGLASDERTKGADDGEAVQGDLAEG